MEQKQQQQQQVDREYKNRVTVLVYVALNGKSWHLKYEFYCIMHSSHILYFYHKYVLFLFLLLLFVFMTIVIVHGIVTSAELGLQLLTQELLNTNTLPNPSYTAELMNVSYPYFMPFVVFVIALLFFVVI